MKKLLTLTLILSLSFSLSAQNDLAERFNNFKKESHKKYNDFRQQANEKYAEFMKYAWEQVEAQKPIEKPADRPVAPVIFNEDDAEEGAVLKSEKATAIIYDENDVRKPLANTIVVTKPQEYAVVILSVLGDTIAVVPAEADKPKQTPKAEPTPEPKPVAETPLEFDEIITVPEPEPQPEPLSPIAVEPEVKAKIEKVTFYYYDTRIDVSKGDAPFRLTDLSDDNLSNQWVWLSQGHYDAFIQDCLTLRKTLRLSDWAYLMMAQEATQKVTQNADAATFLLAYTMAQSGYKMRLAVNSKEELRMLFGSDYHIYDRSYWLLNDQTFYLLNDERGKLRVCNLAFEKEKPVSLMIEPTFVLEEHPTEPRHIETTDKIATVSTNVSTDYNRIQFYNNYPNSYYGDNPLTRWAIYAAAPLSHTAKSSLYPTLIDAMKDKSERQQLNLLLRWVQKGLVYEYDDVVWGGDRAFFAEESLYYPYADCEDRSILLARLVRDLMDLHVALVYYPGHLAMAVETQEEMMGDYITIDGRRFIVCDPTFIGAPVGRTMPGCSNETAKVLIL